MSVAALRRALAAAIRAGDHERAAAIRAQLAQTRKRETAVTEPPEKRG